MIEIDASMFDLFCEEVRAHAQTLIQGLLETEADPGNSSRIEPLMRAAHSIKGAARIVGIDLGVKLAHVMEDALVAAQHGRILLTAADVDLLLQGGDILAGLAKLTPDGIAKWESENAAAVHRLEPLMAAMATGSAAVAQASPAAPSSAAPAPNGQPATTISAIPLQQMESAAEGDFPPAPAVPTLDFPGDPLPLAAEHSMLDRFREELRANLTEINTAIEGDLNAVAEGAKQIRGAARIVKSLPVERVAAAIGSFLAAIRVQRAEPSPAARDWLRYAAATLAGAIETDEESFPAWVGSVSGALDRIASVFERARPTPGPVVPPPPRKSGGEESVATNVSVPAAIRRPPPAPPSEGGDNDAAAGLSPPLSEGGPQATPVPVAVALNHATADVAKSGDVFASSVLAKPAAVEAVVRVTAQSLNRLMGLAGESLVQARWLPSFSTALLLLKKEHDRLAALLEQAVHAAADGAGLGQLMADARRQAARCRAELSDRAARFDDHAARAEDLNARLYREVIISRMRPFGDGVHGLPRLVRDMARALGKEAKLILEGEATEVDRDILERLESPLAHLVRNAVDHGIETPAVRSAAGKPGAGTVRIEARHRAGMLQLTIADDGAGVDLDKLRSKVVARGLSSADVVRQMSEAELLEFLFLPGFSTAAGVTEFSGRGVGLDVVQDTIRKVGGSVRITSAIGRGTAFHLQLPLTLSVIRAVVVEVAGEPYAFPHTRIDRLLRIPRAEVRSLEHRQFITVDGRNIGLVVTAQLLDLPTTPTPGDSLAVVLLSDPSGSYGLVVDAFRGEQDLVVRPLDPRLGKVPNLSAAAILDDGSPVLIVDAEDLLRSTDQFIQTGSLKRCEIRSVGPGRKKRVLVVDDSITVREVERQLLLNRGYDVSVAVDGMEGWNKVRAERYDLLVSDIDMPRMTGLQLVGAVRGDEKLRDLPVVIVSYKERDEDRLKGLEVGANCYLTKSSFHDNRFIEAVEDLIGPA